MKVRPRGRARSQPVHAEPARLAAHLRAGLGADRENRLVDEAVVWALKDRERSQQALLWVPDLAARAGRTRR